MIAVDDFILDEHFGTLQAKKVAEFQRNGRTYSRQVATRCEIPVGAFGALGAAFDVLVAAVIIFSVVFDALLPACNCGAGCYI
jgi:hypothetical protein